MTHSTPMLPPMPAPQGMPILAWARSAVAPVSGAFNALSVHELASPVLQALLKQAQLPPEAIDAVVLGNALGAGGNPARILALAAGLPDSCTAHTIDTQCCSGLDAIAMAVGLLQSGQAEIVVAGGAEAWSRAPIRQTRPRHAGESPQTYERPPFAPQPERDPDMLQSAANYALQQQFTRAEQERYAIESHARAVNAGPQLACEIISIAGLNHDAYPRVLQAERAARMPALALGQSTSPTEVDPQPFALSALTISAKADGAALILLATPAACARWGLQTKAQWLASASVGCTPETPLVAAAQAAQKAIERSKAALHRLDSSLPAIHAAQLSAIELHDAFAVQGLAFCKALNLPLDAINSMGGGIARGHPIGASGAIALVRVLAQLQSQSVNAEQLNALGLAAIAGAGGIGAACMVQWLDSVPTQQPS